MNKKLKEGVKYDQQKLKWNLFPMELMEKIVEVFHHGAEKYEDFNWQKVIIDKPERYENALDRHKCARAKGEMVDPDSNLLHSAHLACNAVMLLWKDMYDLKYYVEKKRKEDK